MKIELNINLNIIGRRNSLHDCTERCRHSMKYLLESFTGADFKRVMGQVEGDDGMLHDEDILVAEVETGFDLVDEILKKVAELSAALEQDCIALRWPHGYEGVLVGPKATTWGAWDESKFQRFERDERSVAI